jgi:hypothetical protein
VCKDCFPLYHFCHTLGLDLPHRLFPCDIRHCLRCTLFVIRADLLYSLLTSGLPHHVHVAHYGRPTVTVKAQQSWVKHRDTPKYKEGDLVWLEGKNLRINQPTAKLAPRRHGPFKITQVMSNVNYRLELPTQWSIHPVFHIDLLTPYKETIMHGPNFT